METLKLAVTIAGLAYGTGFFLRMGWRACDKMCVWLERIGNKPVRTKFYKVILKETGPRKIDVIKCIRRHAGIGLKEAKEATDKADRHFTDVPLLVGRTLSEQEATVFVRELLAEGADASLQRM